MDGWQIDIVKVLVTAAVSGVAGVWGHWVWVRQKQKEADLREQQRQAEYDEFKKKRKLVGAGEVEKMERADKLTDLIIKQKQHQITHDEFTAYRDNLIAGRKPRRNAGDTIGPAMIVEGKVEAFHVKEGQGPLPVEFIIRAAPFDPRLSEEQKTRIAQNVLSVIKEKGPNGFPVGFDEDGTKVEWLPEDDEGDDNNPQKKLTWPMPLMRPEGQIHEAAEEFFEKVWWNRHQNWLVRIESGEEPLKENQKTILETAKKKAKEIEDKYGRDNLGWDDFEWGMVNGKLSALRWVGGSEWDELDT